MQTVTERDERRIKEIIRDKHRLLNLQKKYEEDNKIEFFGIVDPVRANNHDTCCKLFKGPNPKQKELLEGWLDPSYKVFTFTGGNKLGKCVSYQTLIDTPDGEISIGELYKTGKPFKVFAWDGKKKIIANASPPFKKSGLHKCYRIVMSDGRWVEVADYHKILMNDGSYATVERLLKSCYGLQASNSDISQSIHAEGGLHLIQKQSDCQNYYLMDFCQNGGQPHSFQDNDQVSVPLQDDVPEHILYRLQRDVRDKKYKRILSQYNNLLCKGYQFSAQCVAFLSQIFGRTLLPFLQGFQLSPQLCNVGVSEPLPNSLAVQHQPLSFDSFIPLLTDGNKIKSIKLISSCQPVYDCQIEKYHNYFAGGLIHHNTTIGTVIAISSMIGYFPWDVRKTKISNPPIKIRYVGQDWEAHIKTVIVPALKKWWPKNREVETKKNNQGVESLWIDKKTGSSLEIMSNKQEVDVYEGWDGHIIINDEPPKRDIRVACARGLAVTNGRELFTATLLKEAWIDREVIKALNDDGTPDLSVFNVNGEIYDNLGYGLTQEGIDQFAKKLTPEEKDARLRGIPSYMSGLIYPQFNRKIHLKPRFKIPLDWIIDICIDTHPAKEQAVLFIATDPRNYKYLIDEIWSHGDGTFIGEEIIRKVTSNAYRVNKVLIDHSAKGDGNNTFTTYEKIDNVLFRYKYGLETYRKDEDGGIKSVRTLLKSPNNEPAMFVFSDLVRTIYEIEGYMYDQKTFKPQDYDNDMMDNLYALANENTQWSAPLPKQRKQTITDWKLA